MCVYKNMKSRGNDVEGRFGRDITRSIYGMKRQKDKNFLVWEWKKYKKIVAVVDSAWCTQQKKTVYVRKKREFSSFSTVLECALYTF